MLLTCFVSSECIFTTLTSLYSLSATPTILGLLVSHKKPNTFETKSRSVTACNDGCASEHLFNAAFPIGPREVILPLSSDEAEAEVLCPVLCSRVQKTYGLTGVSPAKGHKDY